MPAAKIDPETVTAIAKALPTRRYLAVGQTTSDYPFIINTVTLPVTTTGKTKLLFEKMMVKVDKDQLFFFGSSTPQNSMPFPLDPELHVNQSHAFVD